MNVAGAEADLVGAIAQAEADRQVDVSAAENKYVTALHAEHASQLQGVANANALANVDNAGADLTNYHASAAGITHTAVAAAETHIGVWAQSTADASVALINGITGAGENLVASVGLAVTTSGTMFASAVKSFSQSVGHGVADLVHGVSKAGNQRDESDLGAEADYWADLVDAQADYNDTVATAEVSRASKIATAVRTRIIARETEAAWQAYYTAEEAANAHFEDVDEPAARKTKVEAIGDAMIARAGSLGDNLITETSSMGAAATTYTSADNGATTTFVQTQAAARELHDNDSAVAGKTFIQEAFGAVETNVGAEGAANLALENSLGGARVTAARNLAGAEADYHATASEGTHSYYSASAANSSSPLASWEADREDAFGDWLLSMKLPYQNFVEGQAQREATLGVALVDAEGTVSGDIAAANTVYYTGLANDEVNATASLGAVETTLENLITGQENVYASAMTGEQNTLDDSYASAAKQYAIDEATAEKAFMVALITGTVEDAEQAKALALANAEITRATTEGDADLLWSTGEAGQFRTLRTETANGAFTQVAPTLLAHKTQALGNAGHQATWLTSVTNADNDYAMAQVVAYNNADISDVTTISVFQTASMNHQATQFTALATSSGLPFVDFRAQQSTAQAASLSSQHAGKLASATTIASIYTSAQTDINNLYSAHATAVNAANATWVEAFTTAQNTEATAKELAEKTYVAETAGPLEAYQVQLAVADRAYKIASAVARRDALAAGLTVDNSAAIAAHRQAVQSADGTLNQADATANATRVTSRSSAATTGADAKKLANQAQTEQLNLAEKDLIQDEAARKATRDIDVVTEVHAQALAELNAHTTVVNDLATSLPDNPWAQNEQATWASEVNYLSESLAQDLARAIGDINAKASMTEAMAGLEADLSDVSYDAEYTAEVAGTQAISDKRNGQAGAHHLMGESDDSPPTSEEEALAETLHGLLRSPPKPNQSFADAIAQRRYGHSHAGKNDPNFERDYAAALNLDAEIERANDPRIRIDNLKDGLSFGTVQVLTEHPEVGRAFLQKYGIIGLARLEEAVRQGYEISSHNFWRKWWGGYQRYTGSAFDYKYHYDEGHTAEEGAANLMALLEAEVDDDHTKQEVLRVGSGKNALGQDLDAAINEAKKLSVETLETARNEVVINVLFSGLGLFGPDDARYIGKLDDAPNSKLSQQSLDDWMRQNERAVQARRKAPRGRLVGSLNALTDVEKGFVDDMLNLGKNVEVIPTGAGRTPDFLIDGVRYELKTLSGVVEETADGISGAIANRVMNGRGQAVDIIVDARRQAGITEDIARRGIRRAFGADNKTGGKIQSITIYGPGWTIVVPRI